MNFFYVWIECGPQFVNYARGTFLAFCPHSIWIRVREVMLYVRGNQQTSRAGFNFEKQASLVVEKDYLGINILYVCCKTPVTPEWRPYSVPTAFKKIAERRVARCANASNAVQTLWKRCAIALNAMRRRLL